MVETFIHTQHFPSPDATALFARNLSTRLHAGDVILLSGHVGAGKTHFARALIQSRLQRAGLFEDVPSPTFTLVQTYGDDDCEIWHADLYRLTHPDEVEELGLLDAFDTSICLVEWPDRLAGLYPKDALSIEISNDPSQSETARLVSISAQSSKWKTRVMSTLS